MNVTRTVAIKAPVAEVYDAFADLARWNEILPDVLDVKVLYFDGYHQEFTMTVERPDGPETVRGVRYCRPHRELELVQTTPPPGFARMCGTWTFREAGGATEVTAARDFRLADGHPASEQEVGERLALLLKDNLGLFKAAVERG